AVVEVVDQLGESPTTRSPLTSAKAPPVVREPAPPTPSAAASAARAASCPQGMVSIPGGHFFMGSDDDLAIEKPAHPVTLSPYCMDATELTAARYKKCSDDGLCKRATKANEWPGIDGK